MKFMLSIIAVVLCSSIIIPGACLGASGELATPDPAWLQRMLQDGWEKVEPGVLRRDTGGGVETFTYGPEGLRWRVQKLQERISSLQNEYNRYPSAELAGVIASLQAESAEADSGLSATQTDPIDGGELVAAGCEPTFGVHAAADPLTGSQGVTARADASYSSPCSDLGNVYAYAYARATTGTLMTVKIQEEPKSGGTSLASTATVSVNGSLDCYSEAYAQASSPALGISYETSDTNSTCPGPTTPSSTPSSPSGWTDDGSVVRLTNASDFVRLGPTAPHTKLDISSGTSDFTNLLHLQTGLAGAGAYFGVGNTVNNESYFYLHVYRGGVVTNRFGVNHYGHLMLQPSGEGNVVIGAPTTVTPAAKLQVVGGDVYVSTIGRGVILRSPNGSCFRMVVSDAGALSTTAVGCP